MTWRHRGVPLLWPATTESQICTILPLAHAVLQSATAGAASTTVKAATARMSFFIVGSLL
jgi:hypothetical protein